MTTYSAGLSNPLRDMIFGTFPKVYDRNGFRISSFIFMIYYIVMKKRTLDIYLIYANMSEKEMAFLEGQLFSSQSELFESFFNASNRQENLGLPKRPSLF